MSLIEWLCEIKHLPRWFYWVVGLSGYFLGMFIGVMI